VAVSAVGPLMLMQMCLQKLHIRWSMMGCSCKGRCPPPRSSWAALPEQSATGSNITLKLLSTAVRQCRSYSPPPARTLHRQVFQRQVFQS
jgi:hypothetical protein